MLRKAANLILPDAATMITGVDPTLLVTLLIAPPKWGKTKFFMSNPDAVLLAFEAGHRFQRGFKIEIAKWHEKGYEVERDREGVPRMTVMQALDALEASERYNLVIFDTVDMASRMCMDYHCEKLGVEHPQDAGDYGKGWDITLNSPMRKAILRMLKTGRGVALITHTKNEIARFSSGERARKESTMPAGVARFCVSQADMIMHGELGKKRAGNRLRDRILVCEGDSDTLAGNRTGSMLPERYVVDPENPWSQFVKFFKVKGATDKAEAFYKKIYKK